MTNVLEKSLRTFGVQAHESSVDRVQYLESFFRRNGQLPDDLEKKLCGFFPESTSRAFLPHPKLEVLVGSFISHHTGLRRLGGSLTSGLVCYALSYFWDDQDFCPDSTESGLVDDWEVIDRVTRGLKVDLDDFRLWSRRDLILREWR